MKSPSPFYFTLLVGAAVAFGPVTGVAAQSDSERLEKLERAVELLQKRNTELEAEVQSLKHQKSAPPAALTEEKRSRFVPDSKSAVVEKTETTEAT